MTEKILSDSDLTAASIVAATEGGLELLEDTKGLEKGPFNAALRKGRERLGLEQRELGILVEKSQALISQFETLRVFPIPEDAEKIAQALNMEAEELFPEWLKLFTRKKQRPAQIEIALNESDVDMDSLRRAYELETELTAIDPQEIVEQAELKTVVRDELYTLSDREMRVLELRFGIEDGKQRTLEEVGKEFEVTGDRIRQIEEKALKKLRHPSRAKFLKPFSSFTRYFWSL